MGELYGGITIGNLVAAADVTITEGAVAFTPNTAVYGFATVGLNTTIVELTFGPNSHIASGDSALFACATGTGANDAVAHVNHVSESLIQVRLLDDASAPAEGSFKIAVFRKGAF